MKMTRAPALRTMRLILTSLCTPSLSTAHPRMPCVHSQMAREHWACRAIRARAHEVCTCSMYTLRCCFVGSASARSLIAP